MFQDLSQADEAKSARRNQRFRRVAKMMDVIGVLQTDAQRNAGLIRIARGHIQNELQHVRDSLIATRGMMRYARANAKYGDMLAEAQMLVPPIEDEKEVEEKVERPLNSYVVVVEIDDGERHITLHFATRYIPDDPEFEDRVTREARFKRHTDSEVDDEELITNWIVTHVNGIREDVVAADDIPAFGNELTYMNIGIPMQITEGFKDACGYQLIHEAIGLDIPAVEQIVNKNKADGLTPEDMLAVFVAHGCALIVADIRGAVILSNTLSQEVWGVRRKHSVFVVAGQHWQRPTEAFITRIMASHRQGGVSGFVSDKKAQTVEDDVAIVQDIDHARQIAMQLSRGAIPADNDIKEPMSDELFKVEYKRLKAEYKAWHNIAKKPFKGRALRDRTQEEKDNWAQQQAEHKAMIANYKSEHAARVAEWKSASRLAAKQNKKRRLTVYIPNVDDLAQIWKSEIANKRLYTAIDRDGDVVRSIKLNKQVKLVVDDNFVMRQTAWHELFDCGFSGSTMAGIGQRLFNQISEEHGGFVRSTPNMIVNHALGNNGIGGFTWTPEQYTADPSRTVHAVDFYRQYASIFRDGGFYTVDMDCELLPISCPAVDVFDINGRVMRDRIYLIMTKPHTFERKCLGNGFCDYQLLTSWHAFRPQAIANGLVAGYLKVHHQPKNDIIARQIVDTAYLKLSSDTARKAVVNLLVGLLVADGVKTKTASHYTDSITEAHFLFNTLNMERKHLSNEATYRDSNGAEQTVFWVGGREISKRLDTNLFLNRAIVQRGRARAIDQMRIIEQTPGARLISVHVDAVCYSVQGNQPACLQVSNSPTFGDLRAYNPTKMLTLKPTAHIVGNGVVNAGTHESKQMLDSVTGWDDNLDELKRILADTEWRTKEVNNTATPDMIIANAKPDYRQQFGDANDAYVSLYKVQKMINISHGDGSMRRAYVQGKPGSGKTYYANELARELKSRGFRVAMSSFTHAAAGLLNDGKTLHSLFGISVKTGLSTTAKINKVMAEYDALIVDEAPYAPLAVWRVLQNFPPEFRIYCFGDVDQLAPVCADFEIADTQAMKSVCGYNRLVLNKQWRSNVDFVDHCKSVCSDMGKHGDPVQPAVCKSLASDATIGELASIDRHIFAHNKQRAILNSHITLHNAQDQKEATLFTSAERALAEDYHSLEYPDVDLLADILRRGVDDEASLKIRKYLARARKDKHGQWSVGVRYTQKDRGRRVANVGLQQLPSHIRACVASQYIDLDFENCGYHIMVNVLRRRKLKHTAIKYYIGHREQCLQEVGIGAKKIYLSVLNGAQPGVHHCANLQEIAEEIKGLHDQLDNTDQYYKHSEMKVSEAQREVGLKPVDVSEYLAQLKKHAKPETYQEKYESLTLDGALAVRKYMASFVSWRCFQEENKILEAMIKSVHERIDRKCQTVLCFDGALLHGVKPDELDLRAIERDVLRATQYKMKLKIKPMLASDTQLVSPPPFEGLTHDEMEGLDIKLDEYPAVYFGLPCEMTETVFGHTVVVNGTGEKVRLTNNQSLTFARLATIGGDRCFVFVTADGVDVSLEEHTARTCSRPAFCITAHKAQGRTLTGSVAIHQYYDKAYDESWRTSAEWRYVALTRATNPERVFIVQA